MLDVERRMLILRGAANVDFGRRSGLPLRSWPSNSNNDIKDR
jgi:hypothetical protein